MATPVSVTEIPVKALPMNGDAKKTVADAVGSHASVLEPKLDGWRMLWRIDESGAARSYTRTGNEQTGKLPAIEAEMERVFPPGTIIDGEICAFKMVDGHLTHDRGKVAECLGSGTAKAALRSGAMTLVVFDILAHGGIDARSLPFSKRRELLQQVFANADFDDALVALIPQMEATQDNYDGLLAGGYEGGMVKWLDAPYRSGQRGHGQWKIKATDTVDVVVMGYKPGTPGSSFDGKVGAIMFGQYNEDGILVYRGRCSGMDWDERVDVSAHQDAYLGRVFEMSHLGVQKPTKENPLGAFLSPQFKRFRDDKTADMVQVHDA